VWKVGCWISCQAGVKTGKNVEGKISFGLVPWFYRGWYFAGMFFKKLE